MRITELSVRRKTSTAVIAAALAVLGLYGLSRLPVDLLPDIRYPLVKVQVWWRGATPDEIDRKIADPIERQMATVDGVDYLESSSIEGMYSLFVNFRYGVDVDIAYQDALAAMARASTQLPEDIEPPLVFKADPSQLPVAQITASSDRWDLVRLRTWADEWLQDRLIAVNGVAGAEIVGGLVREIRVHLDPAAIERHGLTIARVVSRLREENVEQFGGRVTAGRKEFIARTVGELRSLDEIRSVVLARDGVSAVRLDDVAVVEDSHEEARVITRLDGSPCVKLSVLKQADANTVEVSRAVMRRLEELRPALPAGVRLGIVENQAQYIESSLAGVRNAAVGAGALVILVIYLFLGSWRQVAVMLVALPLTVTVNFALMSLAGFSLNIFSLGGLVVAMGVVLDNSTVVVENVTRLLRSDDARDADATAVSGTADVGPAIVAATLSFLALFLPFLLVPGMASLLFRELILVMAGIVVTSLTVAITVTPALSAKLLCSASGRTRGVQVAFEAAFARFAALYARALNAAVARPKATVAAFAALLALGLFAATRMGTEFLPAMDDGRVMVKVKLPTGAALGETDRALRKIEELVRQEPLVESAFALAGGKVMGLYTYEIANEGEVDLQLVPRSKRGVSTARFVELLRPKVAKLGMPGVKAMVSQMNVKGIHRAGVSDIEVKVRGPEVHRLFDLATGIAGTLESLDGLTNVYLSMDMTKPEYQVIVDRTRASELGVSTAAAAGALRSLVTGAVATRFREGGEYYAVRVMVPEARVSSGRDIEMLPIDSPAGCVWIGDVAEVEEGLGPVEIVREDQVKQVVVRADAAGGSVGGAVARAKAALASTELPPGYEIAFGGQALRMAEMRAALVSILAFALFFSFVVLAVQFDSLRLPVVILAVVPVCLAGVAAGVAVSGLAFGATAIIGLLVVVSATVNDGVLLLTFAGSSEASPSESVKEAATVRLRPRVMTTVTTIAGFLPLALNLGDGGDMLQAMAVGAIGGLAFEMLVALFLMPAVYVLFTRGRAA